MLSEQVLREITGEGPFCEHLVKLAWPSLSTGAKLQVVSALQSAHHRHTPNWLADIGLADNALIVRYWRCPVSC
jgi:hypothetical protein